MNTEKAFLEWCSEFTFAIGWDRYGSFSEWGFVAIASDNSETFKDDHFPKENLTVLDLTSYLDSGDQEAIDAAQVIKDQVKYIGLNNNPAMAMISCLDRIREYYIHEINNK